jgi:hypothetical protein
MYDVVELTKDKILNCADGMLGKYAVQLERVKGKVNATEGSISEKVHAKAHMYQRDAISVHGMAARPEGVAEGTPDKISPAANDAALQSFLAWYVGEEKSAAEEMTPAERTQGIKKSAAAMDSAFRKLRAGLKEGCDLSEITTCSGVQKWNKDFNEAIEEAEKDAAFRKQCELLGIDPDKPTGPQGVDKNQGPEMTPIEVQLAKIADKMQAVSDLDADRAKDMIYAMDRRADEALAELKKGVGEALAG